MQHRDLAHRGKENVHADHLAALVKHGRRVAVQADERVDERFVVHSLLAHGNGIERSAVGGDFKNHVVRLNMNGTDAAFNLDPLPIEGAGEQLRERDSGGLAGKCDWPATRTSMESTTEA